MANVPTTSWSESTPAGSDNISAGDNRIRELKTQIREVIDVDHDFPSSGQAADNGQHKKVTLQEQADLGTGAVSATILGFQTVSGKGELVYTDEDDNDIQITSAGALDLTDARLASTETLKSIDNAGTGTVDLINANASDQAVLPTVTLAEAGLIMDEVTLPVTGANQGALYVKNDGDQTELYFGEESAGDEVQITDGGVLAGLPSFGAWSDKSASYASQQAATDGFICATANGGADAALSGYTDGSNPPTTVRAKMDMDQSDSTGYAYIFFPVRKDDYWKVEVDTGSITSVYWLPLS